MSASASNELPGWAANIVLPLVNVIAAFLIAGLVVLFIGESPIEVVQVLLFGAFGYGEGIGFTLYYATNFIFTGLAVAVAFHAGLFNIGGEGQATLGGLGVALVCLNAGDLPFLVVLPLAILGAAAFGAAWAYIPAWLQAKRGSHIVITTIMFNFIAAALMAYLLVDVMKAPGTMSPETASFPPNARLPAMHEVLGAIGLDIPRSVRVRLLIARALVRRPRLLVVGGLLEELEPALRAFIVDNLTAEGRTWTLVIASNDPRVARRCDRVGVMRQGRIIAEGPADEVLRLRDIAGVWVGTPDEQLG